MTDETYLIEARGVEEEVEAVYESTNGDYWVITDQSGKHPFGYVSLSDMRQLAEWGTINREILNRSDVMEVAQQDWVHTGPESINIRKE